MARQNRGKQFEECVRKGFEKIPDTQVIRLPDNMGGYKGVKGICDFIIYHYPFQFCLECKCHYGNTLPFACITDKQWQGLSESACVRGVVSGVVVWFIDHNKTFFVPIVELLRLKEKGRKSLNIKHLECDCFEIDSHKKRVLFDYNFRPLIEYVQERFQDE